MYPKLSKQRGAVPTIIFSLLFFSTLFGSCAFIAKNVRGASVNVPFSKITGVETAFASAIQLRTGTVVSVLQQKNQQSVRRQRAKQLTADGIAALERGDESIAQTLFQQALESNPNDAIAHTYLGVLADRRGALSEAESHFAAAVRIDPNSPSAHNNFGAILVRLNRADRAAAEFEASLRLDANQSSALVNLAQIRFASNTTVSLRAARSLFERARAIAPDAEIARALVLISLQLDDKDVAAAKYRAYAVQFYGSTSTATSAATTPGARTQLGSALLAAGLGNEAIEELKAAVAFDSSNVEAIVLLARAYLARRDIPAAGRTLEGAVARGLDVAVIYAELADVYEAFGRPENSIPAMRLAIARDPKSEAYRFRYAMLLTDTKAPAAAVIRLQEALQEFPRSSRLWFALGVAESAQNKTDEAARAFDHARQLDPKFAPASAYLGVTYADRGQYDEAIALYEQALSIDDTMAVVHYLVADALLKQSTTDATRAEKHLARALAIDPSLASARLALAKLYLRAERASEAVNQLERAVASEPNLVEAHYQLGRAYTRLKRTPEAQTEFATFKRLSDAEKEQAQSGRRDIVRRLANVRF